MTDYFDPGREREFYTYYDAYRAISASDPPFTDLYDAEAAARHEPKLAPDPTLTAFCQLGALRMNTKRCMVFFFDQTNGYVLAESTQSHHSGHSGELWLGNTIIPRGLSVCEHTVNIPGANKASNANSDTAHEVHVINDFLENQQFCHRPYVTDGPKARFYAGAPIKTPSGAGIGAYCVLDDKPRSSGITGEEVDFMKHMAALVMGHLGQLRESAEFGRGARMLQGLGVITRHEDDVSGSTVEGMTRRVEKGNSRNLRRRDSTATSKQGTSYTPMLSEYASDYAAETDDVSKKRNTMQKQQAVRTRPPLKDRRHSKQHARGSEDVAEQKSHVAPPLTRAPASREQAPSCHTDGNDLTNPLDKQIKDSFQRASLLLLDAVKSDGVVFLDATAAAKFSNNPVTSRQFSRLGRSDRSAEESDSTSNSAGSGDTSLGDYGSKCFVLGHSEVEGIGGVPSFDNMITERFLRSLMHRYPKGKTWTFDANGRESSEEFLADMASVPDSGMATSGTIARTLREAPKLQRLFNLGLRTLCFAPMWDPVRERWYAAALTWSKSPRHGFSRTNELSYLNAFCDVTMAEILRIEARQEAKSKAALMSSVSHELRSPLHGILGSIDLLKGTTALDWSLVEQIQKCSLNLVDVIDHLLDFAQINSKAQSRKPLKDQHSLEDVKVEASGTSSSWVSLARTTEAIVDAVFYSHYFSNRDRTRPHVDLAIDLSPRSAIHCVISVGAWKRLCTNIVNNALKYTPEGHVKVSLDVEENEAGETHAYLTVADTGIGISPEFLRDSLFKSFAQEDSLAIGTGLGMSLVAQLLKEFKGKIDVQSKKGAGTTVVVKVPVKIPPKTDSEHPDGETKSNPVCLDCSVGYFEPRGNPDGTTDNHRVLSEAVKKTLQDLGVVVCSPESAAAIAILEEDFANLHGDHRTNAQRWLVLCESFASATRLRERFHQDKSLEFVPQPYGPERLATAIRALCGSDPAPTVDHTKENDQCPGASDDTTEPLRSMIESSFSALPSPPLDITLEHLNLTMPDTVAAQDAPCPAPPAVEDIPERETLDFTEPTTVPVAVEKPASSSPDNTYSTAEIKQQHESLLLLLVDDNPINLKLLTMVADRNHFPRLLATNGREAVEVYKSHSQESSSNESSSSAPSPPTPSSSTQHQQAHSCPDVVLLDLNMPVMDGFEAARQIRQFEKQTNAPRAVIIAITGLGDDIARAKAYQHGFDYFMSKPVRPQHLTNMLESIIHAKKRGAEG